MPSTASCIPSTLTHCHYQNTKHNCSAARYICFIKTTHVYLVGVGGLNQVFHHQIFQEVSWDHCLLKKTIFDTQNIYINIIY